MLVSCSVVTLGRFYLGDEIEIAIESFASFFLELTSKHHKKLKLIIIDDRENEHELRELIERNDIRAVTEIVAVENQERVEAVYKNAGLLLLPSRRNGGLIVPEALSYSIPILCYETEEMRSLVDLTCAMFVKAKCKEDSVSGFAQLIDMLYFDPEVRKILKRGALSKYHKDFSWGLKGVAS